MGNLGVFEVMANAGKTSAEAEAKKGHEFEKNVDRAIFRARERFGAYLANSQSKQDWDERWSEVKPLAIKVIAEVLTPTPGVIRRVGAALRPAPAAPARTKQDRPSSAKTDEKQLREAAYAHRDEVVPGSGQAVEPKDLARVGATQKHAWTYDQTTKLYTSNDPMQRFACPNCGHEQDSLGFTKCACGRQWNSWPVRQASSEKTSASTYVLMAREIKMRGDQFKLAAAGNVKVAGVPWVTGAEGAALVVGIEKALVADLADLSKVADAPMPQEPPPGVSQPMPGSMPGDNSMAMGVPMGPSQPAVPGGAPDQDRDLAGGVTEDSPIDQIQDALQDAIVALKDVQMLSINPQLVAMGGLKLSVVAAERRKVEKVTTLRTAMDRFWNLHKQMNYVAEMLAKEANEALRTADPRITAEAEFVKGFEAASRNEPLPAKTGRAYLEGYVAFHTQADTYDTGADIGKITVPTGQDETDAGNEGSNFLNPTDSTNEIRGDAGPFDSSQPASREFASQIDADIAQGDQDRGQGSSGSIQPTSARKATTQKGGK